MKIFMVGAAGMAAAALGVGIAWMTMRNVVHTIATSSRKNRRQIRAAK